MLLELKNISKQFSAPSGGSAVKVLDDLSLSIGQGESVSIAGPSGSGKSTLLNIMGSLDTPTSGEVVFDGRDLLQCNAAELARIRNSDIGFVFQMHHLLQQCTVLENVLIPTLPERNASKKGEAETRARNLLDRVGLGNRITYRPGRLSGGERQRVAVVRALINNPKLLLADEPTGSLDHSTADDMAELLIELNREEGVTLILVTHSLELANRMARVLELKDGTLNG